MRGCILELNPEGLLDLFISILVVLKNCESELSYMLAELFNMCLKASLVL